MGFKDLLQTIISVAPNVIGGKRGIQPPQIGPATPPFVPQPRTPGIPGGGTPPFVPPSSYMEPMQGGQDMSFRIGRDDMTPARPLAATATEKFFGNFNKLSGNDVIEPVAPNPSVPESPQTVAIQAQSMQNPQSPRKGLLITPGEQLPAGFDPSAYIVNQLPGGRTLYTDPAQTMLRTPEEVQGFVDQGGLAELIGKVESNEQTGAGPTVLTTQGGVEANASRVSTPEAAQAQIAMDQQAYPGSESTIVDAQDVAQQRQMGLLNPVMPSAAETRAAEAESAQGARMAQFAPPAAQAGEVVASMETPPPGPDMVNTTAPYADVREAEAAAAQGRRMSAFAPPGPSPAQIDEGKPKPADEGKPAAAAPATRLERAKTKVDTILNRLENGYSKTPKKDAQGNIIGYEYGPDYDQDRDLKDFGRGAILSFIKGLRDSKGDWKAALVSAIGGGAASLWDPNFDNKLRDQFELERANAEYERELAIENRELEREKGKIGIDVQRADRLRKIYESRKAQLESIPNWDVIRRAEVITPKEAQAINAALNIPENSPEALQPKDWRQYKEFLTPSGGMAARPITGPDQDAVPITGVNPQGQPVQLRGNTYQIPDPANSGQMLNVSLAQYLTHHRQRVAREQRELDKARKEDETNKARIEKEATAKGKEVGKRVEKINETLRQLESELPSDTSNYYLALERVQEAQGEVDTLTQQYEAEKAKGTPVDEPAWTAALNEARQNLRTAQKAVNDLFAKMRLSRTTINTLRRERDGLLKP